MITEAELIEVEARSDLLLEFTSDVVGAVANAMLDDADYRDGLTAIDTRVDQVYRDLQRLIKECRSSAARGAGQ